METTRGALGINTILGKTILLVSISICFLQLSTARPTEEPTKFTLTTHEGNPQSVDSQRILEQGKELIGRVADAIRIGRGRIVNSVTLARNIAANRAETLVAEAQNNVPSVIAAKTDILNQGLRSLEAIQTAPVSNIPATSQDTARLESEAGQGLLERPFSKSIGLGLENFLNPKPLLDGIKEEEKYGNTGDKFIGIGRAIVNGFEGFSNFLNTVVDLPRNVIQQKSRGLTETLNNLGARIIGIQ